jgi:hypothetical protein
MPRSRPHVERAGGRRRVLVAIRPPIDRPAAAYLPWRELPENRRRKGNLGMIALAKTLLATTALWIVGASSASALMVKVASLNANVSLHDGAATDGSGATPVATASASRVVTVQGISDTTTGFALQNENGFSSLELTVNCDGFRGTACTGGTDRLENRATAIRELTFTNDGAVAQSGTFMFSLSGIVLESSHYGGGPIDPEASVQFQAGATSGATYDAELTLRSRFPASGGPVHEIVSSDKFSASVTPSECSFGFCYKGVADVDPLSGSLDLGVLAPGRSVTVFTTFDLRTVFNATELGAEARGVDPGQFSWVFADVGGGGSPTAPVPLPAGGLLLLSGLGVMTGARWRRVRLS